ncbi:hypothetical protein BDR04DRAFT_782134 [Suillus decipiens]|nr:hypothetical protein BDR04DRAFT_782134 [Suillus decipiens]
MHIFLIHSTHPTYNIAVTFQISKSKTIPLPHASALFYAHGTAALLHRIFVCPSSLSLIFYLFSSHTIIFLLLLFSSRTFIFHFVF